MACGQMPMRSFVLFSCMNWIHSIFDYWISSFISLQPAIQTFFIGLAIRQIYCWRQKWQPSSGMFAFAGILHMGLWSLYKCHPFMTQINKMNRKSTFPTTQIIVGPLHNRKRRFLADWITRIFIIWASDKLKLRFGCIFHIRTHTQALQASEFVQ